MSYRDILDSELQQFQIDLDLQQKETLAAYCDELTRWNRKMNLTGLAGPALVRRLVVEPVWVGLQLKSEQGVLLDIGSGNGSPAIPLQVVCRFRKCQLVEARTKRAAFLRHLVSVLKLGEMDVHRARFSDVAGAIDPPDWVTLQAVSLTKELLDSLRPVARSTTTVVWISSATTKADLEPMRSFAVPITGTRVSLYQL